MNFHIAIRFSDNQKPSNSEACLTWDVVAQKVPWGVILLLGGGYAMALATNESNLSQILGEGLKSLDVLPNKLIVLIVSLFAALMTEAISNVTAAAIFLPILKDLVSLQYKTF